MRTNRRGLQRKALKATAGERVPRDLREKLGAWLAERRREAGMTQQEMMPLVGLDTDSALSAIETGRVGLPVERYALFTKALGIPQEDFAKVVLRYTDPWVYLAIFKEKNRSLLDDVAKMDLKLPPKGTPRDGPE